MVVKRINMDLDTELWKRAKKAAIDQDVDLRDWISEAIKEKLEREGSGKT
jgi:predicted HicB family RNase H-like nuclease